MQAAEPGELRLLQPRDHPEDADLLGIFQLGLESHHVEQAAQRIVLAQLDHRMGPPAALGFGQAHRLHRAEAQGLAPARRHHLDGQAAVEIGRARFPFLEFGLVARQQRIDEGLVLRAVERAVDVVGAVAGRAALVVARLEPGHIEIDALAMDDGRDGIEESQRIFAAKRADRLGQARRGQWTGGDDRVAPFDRRQAFDLAARKRNQRARRAAVAVTSSAKPSRSTASAPPAGSLWRSPRCQDQRAATAHLLMQQADGVVHRIVGAEGVRTDELGKLVRFMRFGTAQRPHFMQHHALARAGQLPRRFAAGEPAADHMHGPRHYIVCHGANR